jgi:putative membrane protein
MHNHSLAGKWMGAMVAAGVLAVAPAIFAQGADDPSRTGPGTSGIGAGSDAPGNVAGPSPATRMGTLGDSKPGGVIDNVNNPNDDATRAGAARPGSNAMDDASHAAGTKAAGESADAQIVAKLHHVNQMEITAGKLAQEQGQAKQVRDFGARLMRDHQAADKKLMSYADKAGLDANAMPPAGSNEDAKMEQKMDHVRTLSGAAFDREFASLMEEGHQKTIEAVESAQQTVSDPKLKAMLGQLLPTLQKHHHLAAALASTTGNAAIQQDTGATAPKTVQGRHGASGTTR